MLSKIKLATFTIPVTAVCIALFWYSILAAFELIVNFGAVPNPITTTTTTRTMASTNGSSTNGSTAVSLPHARITPRRSNERGHADHGWLNTYHTFAFASYQDPAHGGFGSLRVLNEDRVAPKNGFPTHPHRDFEIFSYILDGELTHRDSIKGKGGEGSSKDDYYVMKRGDLQFTTGGTGIAHSEANENTSKWVHFLQIWVKPWARSLPPIYHTSTFNDASKRDGFATVLSPLVGGPKATSEQEKAAKPTLEGTIPIHADFVMGAGLLASGKKFSWNVGKGAVSKEKGRNVYVHLSTTQGGKASVRLMADKSVDLKEGDGAYIKGLNAGDNLVVESTGTAEAEVVVLDSD